MGQVISRKELALLSRHAVVLDNKRNKMENGGSADTTVNYQQGNLPGNSLKMRHEFHLARVHLH